MKRNAILSIVLFSILWGVCAFDRMEKLFSIKNNASQKICFLIIQNTGGKYKSKAEMEVEILKWLKTGKYDTIDSKSIYTEIGPSSKTDLLKYHNGEYFVVYFIEESRIKKLSKQDTIKLEQLDKVIQITYQQLADMNWTIVYEKSERTME